ncbi:MAG TPA: hypothetical protein VLT36_00730, partial [Candidatus Dormibacteraeota bacterium]|nr:hypothetical protein [Candidatus Dormibacteraeota bacterium]
GPWRRRLALNWQLTRSEPPLSWVELERFSPNSVLLSAQKWFDPTPFQGVAAQFLFLSLEGGTALYALVASQLAPSAPAWAPSPVQRQPSCVS